MAEKTERKLKALNNARASPSAKLDDKASSSIDKVKSKTDRLNNKKARVKLEAKDEATSIIAKAQNKINGWIKTGAKKVISIGLAGTVALGGVGLGTSVKTFASFEQGMKNVQAISGATGAEFGKLTDKAKEMGRATEFTARDSADAFYYMGMAGWKTQEMLNAIPGVLSLASAGGTDLAITSDIVTDGLTALGMTAKDTDKFVDIMAATITNSNTSVELMGETLKYVGSMGGALGVSMEDLSLATGLMANASVKGSMAGTALRGGLTRLIKPTKMVKDALGKYDIALKKTDSGSLDLTGTIGVLRDKLGGLDDVTKSTALAQIFGQEAVAGWAAVINASDADFNKLSSAIANSKDRAKEIADVKLDSLNGQWTILKSAVEGAQIELGEKLAPYAKQFVSWLTGKMPDITNGIVKFVDYLSKNTTTIKALATSVVGLGVAFTGLSAVGKVGNAVTGVNGLVKVFKGAKVAEETTAIAGGLKSIGLVSKLLPAIISPVGLAIAGTALVAGTAVVTNANLMKKGISTTKEELGPLEKIMNRINGSVFKSKSEMQSLGLVYEDFGQNIGSEFKKKVEDSTKSIREFQFFINKINLDGVIDEKESIEFDSRINEMCDNAIKTIESKKEETQSALSSLFADDGNISEAEQATLDYFAKKYDTQITAEQRLQNEIYDIKKEAIANHGKLLDEDIRQIKEKQQEIARIELEATSGNQDEINYAKNKFKARAEGVDIKDASQLLKESAKNRDDAIVEIKAKYDTYIDNLKSELNDKSKKIDPKQRQELESSLSSLEKARADKIKSQNNLYNENLNTLYGQNPNLKGKLNQYTGEELTGKDISSQKAMDKIKETYSGLERITKSGNYRLWDASEKAWRELQVLVDSNTGEIIGLYDSMNGHVGGYTQEMADNVKKLGKSHTDLNTEAAEAMKLLSNATVNAKGQIIASNNEIVASLDQRKISTDGVRSGIINLNGTPIEIQSNSAGIITNMDEVINTILKMPSSKSIILNSNANQTTNEVNGVTDSVNKVPKSKTITITTIFKKITSWIGDKVDKINDSYKEQNEKFGTPWALESYGYATGTNNATPGLHPVAEHGMELVIGRRNKLFTGGEKVLTNSQTKKLLFGDKDNKKEEKIVPISTPQIQVAGTGGISFGEININVDGNQDVDNIIQQAIQEFGYKLKEALTNIKK